MKYPLYLMLLVLSFTSCFKKDKPIILPEATSEINGHFMGNDADHYLNELFFDLSTNTFYERPLADWDLCFESSDTGKGISLNTGFGIEPGNRICKAIYANFNEPNSKNIDSINNMFKNSALLDGSDGKLSPSPFSNWKSYKTKDNTSGGFEPGIYIIELIYLSGNDRFVRMQILSETNDFFACKFTDLINDNPPVTKIYKNKLQSYTYYSFKNGGKIVDNAEPPANAWDIEFIRYRTILHISSIYYPVTGVLTNPNNVKVAIDASSKFEDITSASINSYSFSSYRYAIGYDYWKTIVQLGAYSKYVVHPEIIYIIQDTDGYYYKLRFIDFYDKQSRSGNPKFEYVRIK